MKFNGIFLCTRNIFKATLNSNSIPLLFKVMTLIYPSNNIQHTGSDIIKCLYEFYIRKKFVEKNFTDKLNNKNCLLLIYFI